MGAFAIADFPGINQVLSASMSFSVGTTPSVAIVEIAPQQDFVAQTGDLTFSDGDTSITFAGCRIDTSSFEYNHDGFVVKLHILDRRWMWQRNGGGGSMNGYWNLRDDQDNVYPSTKKKPQDLATLCLEEMGEADYDVSALPTDVYPQTLWDCVLPSEALAKLCEELGFRVVLGLDDSVTLCQIGQGADLPITPDITSNSFSMDVPGIPDTIAVVTAKVRFQEDFLLEAVGIEVGNQRKLVPLDQLSYLNDITLADDVPEFDAVLDKYGKAAHDLAVKSVLKYYRVKMPVTIHGYTDTGGNTNATISDPWKLRLEDFQVDTVVDTSSTSDESGSDDGQRSKRAIVYGVWCHDEDGDLSGNNTAASTEIDPSQTDDDEVNHIEFSIDKKNAVVMFNQPVYYNSGAGGTGVTTLYTPAPLILRTACTLLDEKTFAPVRYAYSQSTGGSFGTPDRVDVFDDLGPTSAARYKTAIVNGVGSNDVSIQLTFDHVDTNLDSDPSGGPGIKDQATDYWNGIMQFYQQTTPQTITYGALKYIDLDGAIQHLTLHVSKHGTSTTVSRNNEQLHRIKSQAERRLMERLKHQLQDSESHQHAHGWHHHRWRA